MTNQPSSSQTDSLVKRLAGPSTGKAGLALDQTEINAVIAEVSKGSKFYENEKRKDKELTDKIHALLKVRDELLKNANIAKIEAAADQIIAQLEAQRDLTQTIVHVDMDAFFANVEVLDKPHLAGLPFGVGGGVLSTASYEARKYGVRSGMASFVAKKLCPDLILVKSSYGKYGEMSNKVFDVFRRYDPNLCPAGCDEGYLNITQYCMEHDITPTNCVQEMRAKVFEETSLTVSAGIAPNTMLAKICSDKNKPNGQYEMNFDANEIVAFMHDLSIRKIPGIGRVNERLLDSIGVKTCGDIYKHRAVISLLDKQFGLEYLLNKYLGLGNTVVAPHQREERKSIGSERTFRSLSDKDKLLAKLEDIAEELAEDMETQGWAGRTISLKYKLDSFQVFTRAKSFDRWITKKEDLFATGKELLLHELPLTLRLIGLRVTKLKDLREDSNAGIKRFFASGANDNGPRKRPRLDDDSHENAEAEDDVPLDYDDFGDAFAEATMDEDIGDLTNVATTSTVPDKPQQPSTLQNAKPSSSISKTPASTTRSSPSERSDHPPENVADGPALDGVASQSCPICQKTWQTDNEGLNAHVDFCLSRNVIQQAQVEASSHRTPSTKKSKPSAKPSSSAGGIDFWARSGGGSSIKSKKFKR